MSISYEIRKAVQQRRSDKVKKLVKFQQIWIGPRFVASYIQIKGSAPGHFIILNYNAIFDKLKGLLKKNRYFDRRLFDKLI